MKYSNNNAEEGKKREKNTKESAAVLLLSVESQRELKEIELLRAHILSYRTSTSSTFAPTSSSSRAVKCTIAALDMERDQIMRNEKLKRKPSRVMKPIKRKRSRVMKPILKIGMKPSKLKDDFKIGIGNDYYLEQFSKPQKHRILAAFANAIRSNRFNPGKKRAKQI